MLNFFRKTFLFSSLMFLVSGCCPAELVTPDSDSADATVPVTVGLQDGADCGWNVGDDACDFMLLDQNNEPWQLSENQGDLILIDLSAMWCAPCQAAASTAQAAHEQYADKGFQYVSVLIADLQNDAVELSDVQYWTTTYGITTAPVLQGDRGLLYSPSTINGFPIQSWPTFIWVDRDGTVLFGLRGFSEEYIKQLTEQYL